MNDWLERELEDYIVANPRKLYEHMFPENMYEVNVLGRQVRCQYGIIDVLLWARNPRFSYAVVVECKAKHEKGLAVEQVERYVSAVRRSSVYENLPDDAWPSDDGNDCGWARNIKLIALPAIVAPSFDAHLISTYSGILISTTKVNDIFVFERQHNWNPPGANDQLDAALSPVIKRAQEDAKIRYYAEKIDAGWSFPYRYSVN